MSSTEFIVYLERVPKRLTISENGPDFEGWEDGERYPLEFSMDEEACAVEGVWDPGKCLSAMREAGYFVRPADGSYGILNHRDIAGRYLPGVRTKQRPEGGVPVRFPVGEDGTWLDCWRSSRTSKKPVLVLFHGNGETVVDWAPIAKDIEKFGYQLFVVEYPGYGASDGGTCRLGDMLDDVYPIADAVGVPPEKMVVFGRSVGSLFAAEFVDRFPKTRALVLESGIHDVYERLALRVTADEMGISEAEYKAAVDSALNQGEKLGRYKGPALLLHTEQDDLVAIGHAEANLAALGSQDKTLVAFEEGSHNTIFAKNEATYLEELGEFLKKVADDSYECHISGYTGHATDPFYEKFREGPDMKRGRRRR